MLPLDRVTATALVLRAGVGVAEEVPRNTTRETVGGVRLFPLPGKSISMHVAVLDRLRSSTLCWVELGAADVAASARPRGTLRLDMPAKSGNKSAASKPPFFFLKNRVKNDGGQDKEPLLVSRYDIRLHPSE